jgi:NAD(P)-dependent dehydrogenase (short-subunit alcohol dehydrogenase family)
MSLAITGGAGAIGSEIARHMAQEHKVFVLDIDKHRGGEVEAELGSRCKFIACDVRSEHELAQARDTIANEDEAFSGLVIAAGVNKTVSATSLETSEWNRVMDTNLTGAFLSMQAFFPLLSKCSGSIVAIASKSGSISNKTAPHCHYNASKAGLIHLCRSVAAEWAELGVRVNCVSPGYILTPMTEGRDKEHEIWKKDIPMGRLGSTSDVVGAVEFLLNDSSSFVTGHDLLIDGGYTIW